MIIYGTGGDTVDMGFYENRECPKCGDKKDFNLHCAYRYGHIYYIFSFVKKKKYYLFCNTCGSGSEIPAHEALSKGQTPAIPFRRRYGWVALILIVGVIIALAATGSVSSVFTDKHARAIELNDEGLALDAKEMYEEAIEKYTEAIKLAPELGAPYYNRAIARGEIGDFEGAIADFDMAVKKEVEDKYVALSCAHRGFAKANLGHAGEAARDYEAALRTDPECAPAVGFLATHHFLSGDNEAALSGFTRAIELYEKQGSQVDAAEHYASRAYVRFCDGDNEGALEDYAAAIEKDPTSGYLYNDRAEARLGMKDYDGAIADYGRALELFGADSSGANSEAMLEAYIGRGTARLNKEDYPGAVLDLDAAVALNPGYPFMYYIRGNARVFAKDFEGAAADYDKALGMLSGINEKVGMSAVLVVRANLRLRTGDFEGAFDDARKAVELDPENLNAYLARGNLLSKGTEYDEAMNDIRKALELAEKSGVETDIATVLSSRAGIYYFTGQYDKALADENRAVELDPESPWGWGGRSLTRAKGFQEYEKAIEDAEKAIELAPDDSYGYINRAYSLALSGRFDEALADCEKAIKLEGHLDSNWYKYALVLSFKKDRQGMLEKLSRAVEINPYVRKRAREDEDFEPWLEDPEFVKITGEKNN